MNLSKRLRAVADLIPKSNVIADIGCDHAHVAIYLTKNNRADKVIACDVNEGPLAAAENNIREAGLSGRIETRLSDGLASLEANEADGIIIAGMGGNLMMKIIDEGFERLCAGAALVLQPQSEIYLFRRFLYEKGLDVQSENMVFEDGKFYPMMLAIKKSLSNECDAYSDASEGDFAYGKLLIEGRNPVLLEYLAKEYDQLLKIKNNLTTMGSSDRMLERLEEVNRKIVLNRETAGRYV